MQIFKKKKTRNTMLLKTQYLKILSNKKTFSLLNINTKSIAKIFDMS